VDNVLSLTVANTQPTSLRERGREKEREKGVNGGGVHMLHNAVLRSHTPDRAARVVRGPHVWPHVGPHVPQPC